MLALLLRLHKERFLRYFEKNRTAKIIIAGMFVVVLLFLALGVYAGLKAGFRYIALDQFFREALTFYIIELFLLVSFVLVFASALITGIFSLFRGSGELFLMASPEYGMKPVFVLLRMFFTSLWPLLVIILPALFAIHKVFGLGALGFMLSLFSVILLVLFAVLCAVILLLGIANILYLFGKKRPIPFLSERTLTLVTTVTFIGTLMVTWGRFHSVNLVEFFQARLLSKSVPDITPILDQFHFFPSHLSALTMYASLRGEYMDASFYAFVLGLILFVSGMIFYALSSSHLFMWQVLQEGRGGVRVRSSLSMLRSKGEGLTRTKSALGAIFLKEYITFIRDPRGMLWFGFILVIWAIQSASSFILVHGLRSEPVAVSNFPSFVSMLAFAGILYFIAMFVLRFAFPSFSIERRRAWVIGSAPVDLGTVFMSKLFFFTELFSLLAIIFASFNASVRVLSAGSLLLFFVTIVLAVFTITTYGLSLGAIFPNTETDDPEMLTTTLPGLAFIAGALLFGAVGAFVLNYLFRTHILWPYVLFVLLSYIAAWTLIRISKKTLSQMEF